MNNEPKALNFGNENNKKNSGPTGPSVLHFTDDKKAKELEELEYQKHAKEVELFKVNFDSVQAVKPNSSNPVSFNNPKSDPPPHTNIFHESASPLDGLIQRTMEKVRKDPTYAGFSTEFSSIERQLKQLLPVKLEVIVAWGAAALDQEAQLALSCAKLIKENFELGASALLQRALESLKPRDNSLLKRFAKHDEIDNLLPSISALREQLKLSIPRLTAALESTVKSETRLMVHLTVLSLLSDMTKLTDEINKAVQDRRLLLQQAATQAGLSKQQLNQAKENVADFLTRIEQLLNITIPAYKMAHTNK
jgi:phage I-like protein